MDLEILVIEVKYNIIGFSRIFFENDFKKLFYLKDNIFHWLEKLNMLSKIIVKRTLNRELKLELKLSSYKFILTVCVRAPSAPVEAFP